MYYHLQGLRFSDIMCSGCYVEGVSGIHWQCAHCYEYSLCHSCYLLGRHCQEHPFFRVESKKQAARYWKWEGPQTASSCSALSTVLVCRVKMSCRAGAKRVEAKGVFVGAEVVRGPHWSFGDQDGIIICDYVWDKGAFHAKNFFQLAVPTDSAKPAL